MELTRYLSPKKTAIALILMLAAGCRPVVESDYYFPAHFNGEVAIVYLNKNDKEIRQAVSPEKIYVPDSGIVFIKRPFAASQIVYRYFIKQPNGNYDTIREYNFENKTQKKYVFDSRIMGFFFPLKGKTYKTAVTNKMTSQGCEAELFYVGDTLDSGQKRDSFENHIQDLVKVLISKQSN